jgi:hypothetical protein
MLFCNIAKSDSRHWSGQFQIGVSSTSLFDKYSHMLSISKDSISSAGGVVFQGSIGYEYKGIRLLDRLSLGGTTKDKTDEGELINLGKTEYENSLSLGSRLVNSYRVKVWSFLGTELQYLSVWRQYEPHTSIKDKSWGPLVGTEIYIMVDQGPEYYPKSIFDEKAFIILSIEAIERNNLCFRTSFHFLFFGGSVGTPGLAIKYLYQNHDYSRWDLSIGFYSWPL